MLRHEFTQFAAALTGPAPVPGGIVAPPGAVLHERFAVYRNNVFASLIDVLAQRFAVTCAVVGEDFFRQMARAYIQQCRPTSAVLDDYGDGFPDFVRQFPAATSLQWLADLTRLEVLWSQSWAAADAPALAITDLVGIPPDALLEAQVVVHPATRLLRSDAPVASLWQAHQDASAGPVGHRVARTGRAADPSRGRSAADLAVPGHRPLRPGAAAGQVH